MKTLTCLFISLLALTAVSTVPAAEEDAVVPIYIYARTGGWNASGFAVGDGSYVVASSASLTEQVAPDKYARVKHTVVVSSWTGEAYPAKIVATDEKTRLALLKIASPAVQPVPLAKDETLSRAMMATLGQLVSGEEVGDRFPAEILAFESKTKSGGPGVERWKAANACITEVRGQNYLFFSKVDPPEKARRGGLVVRRGVGALGMFQNRLLITGIKKPAVFYRVTPVTDLRKFLTKSGVPAAALAEPPSIGAKAADADASFAAMCLALSTSITAAQGSTDAAKAAVALRPKSAIAQLLLASALSREGKNDDALKAMDQALEIDPSIPDGRLNRGTILAALGKTAEAETEFRKAMQDDPKDSRPLASLAVLLAVKAETLPEAVKLARQAVDLSPDNLPTRVMLARLLKQSKEYDAAISELQKVLEAAPKWGEVRVALGATYEAAGKPDLAESAYRKLVEMEPESIDAHLTLIDFLISSDKKDEAKQAIESARKLKLDAASEEALKKLEARLVE